MFRKYLLLPFYVFSLSYISAQVAISTASTSPDNSAMLDIQSSSKGVLIPRMNSAQRTAISSPATGLLVYDITTADFWFYSGAAWVSLSQNLLADDDNDTKIQVEETPDEDKIRFDLAGTEKIVLNGSTIQVVNSGQSVFLGEGAGNADDLSDNNNTFVGYYSGIKNTSGFGNSAFGANSLERNTTGASNVAIGKNALSFNITGMQNTGIGERSLYANASGIRNLAAGYYSMHNNVTGDNNVAMGYRSLFSNSHGNDNVAIGSEALSNTTGSANTAIGFESLMGNTIGESNVGIGNQAAHSNTSGSENIAIGEFSSYSNLTGNKNIALGVRALYTNIDGTTNVAIGNDALYSQTKSNSIAIGDSALVYNSLGSTFSLHGIDNIAIGKNALLSNTVGHKNIAVGHNSMPNSTSVQENTVIGSNALLSNTGGDFNVALGHDAGKDNITGDNNTFVGYRANTSGSGFYSRSIALGTFSTITASDQVRIGAQSINSIGGWENWTNVSDGRFKKDINNHVVGLNFILKLKPITYKLDDIAINHFYNEKLKIENSLISNQASINRIEKSGFIAQEVEAAANSVGYDFSGVDKPKNESDYYGLRYSEFVVPLVKAVQEQQKMISELQQEVRELKLNNPLVKQ